jgi:hypothetical protein
LILIFTMALVFYIFKLTLVTHFSKIDKKNLSLVLKEGEKSLGAFHSKYLVPKKYNEQC